MSAPVGAAVHVTPDSPGRMWLNGTVHELATPGPGGVVDALTIAGQTAAFQESDVLVAVTGDSPYVMRVPPFGRTEQAQDLAEDEVAAVEEAKAGLAVAMAPPVPEPSPEPVPEPVSDGTTAVEAQGAVIGVASDGVDVDPLTATRGQAPAVGESPRLRAPVMLGPLDPWQQVVVPNPSSPLVIEAPMGSGMRGGLRRRRALLVGTGVVGAVLTLAGIGMVAFQGMTAPVQVGASAPTSSVHVSASSTPEPIEVTTSDRAQAAVTVETAQRIYTASDGRVDDDQVRTVLAAKIRTARHALSDGAGWDVAVQETMTAAQKVLDAQAVWVRTHPDVAPAVDDTDVSGSDRALTPTVATVPDGAAEGSTSAPADQARVSELWAKVTTATANGVPVPGALTVDVDVATTGPVVVTLAIADHIEVIGMLPSSGHLTRTITGLSPARYDWAISAGPLTATSDRPVAVN